MYCWWCHWGWPRQIHEVYDRALVALGGNRNPIIYGPAHVVWEDENWDLAQDCLDNFDNWERNYNSSLNLNAKELQIVRKSLVELLGVPAEYKCEPAEYKGINPEKFPPPDHWEMIRRP